MPNPIQSALWVGAGGFLGSAARYLLATSAHRLMGDPWNFIAYLFEDIINRPGAEALFVSFILQA